MVIRQGPGLKFEFSAPQQILFGAGVRHEAALLAKRLALRVLFVSGSSTLRYAWLREELEENGLAVTNIAVAGEPTTRLVQQAAECARSAGCEMVIALGGGSVLDAGKILAALLTNTGDVFDYLEVVGRGLPLIERPVPFVALPTTAGTGTEATKNSVLRSVEHGVKASVRSNFLLPATALVDPELTYSMPPAVTAATGLDALTQLIEAYVCRRANPLTDQLCREGIGRIGRALLPAYHKPDDISAREDMCLASLFSGMALANAGLGAVHGIAGPLGGMCGAPHGAVCASLLAQVMEANLRCADRAADCAEMRRRYDEIAGMLLSRQNARAEEGLTFIRSLCEQMQIPGLFALGLREEDISLLAQKSLQASSMKGNPVQFSAREIEELICRAALSLS